MPADVQVTFGGDLSELGTASDAAKAQLRTLELEAKAAGTSIAASGAVAGQSMESVTAHAHSATVGTAFWTRELRALGDELSSGRYRQADGTFLNLAVHAVQAGGAWAIANPTLIALGAAAVAAAGAVAYLVYESVAANNAMKNLELAAVIAQYQLTNEQASALRDTIEQFANVGASDAAEIAKPFIALGEGGGLIATQLAPYLQLLAENMGQKLPEAAKTLAKNFEDLDTKGRALVAATNGVNSAQLQQFNHFVQTGQTGRAYLLVIDALTRGVADFADKQKLQTAELKDAIPSLEAAESGVMGLSRAQSDLVGAVDAANAKLAAQKATLDAGRQALESVAASDQKAYEAANKTAAAIDKQGTEIERLKSQIEVLGTGLTKAMASANPDPISIEHWRAAILQAQRDLEELTSKQGNLFGGVTQQVDHAVKQIQDKFKGSKAVELQLEIKTITTALDKGGVPEKDRQALQDQLAARQKALDEAEAKDTEQKFSEEVQSAKEAVAGIQETLDERLKTHQITMKEWVQQSVAALDQEQDAIQDAADKAVASASLGTQQRKAIWDKEEKDLAAIALKEQKDFDKASEEMTKSWQTAGDAVAGILNSQVSALLRGTESIGTAFRNMGEMVVEELAKMAVKLAVDVALAELLSAATGGALGGFGAGGVGGFLGRELHVPGFATGTDYVPHTGLVLAHQGEMIVPAHMNPNNSANSIGGGSFGGQGGSTSYGGDTHNYHIHSNSADPREVARQVAKMWDSNQSLRPKY